MAIPEMIQKWSRLAPDAKDLLCPLEAAGTFSRLWRRNAQLGGSIQPIFKNNRAGRSAGMYWATRSAHEAMRCAEQTTSCHACRWNPAGAANIRIPCRMYWLAIRAASRLIRSTL